jgi:ketosteroid isomerase-like protein
MTEFAVLSRKLGCRAITVAAIAQLLLFGAWAFPLQGKNSNPPKAQKSDARHQIDRLEDRWRSAMLNSDANVLDSLLAEDYVAIMANGTLQTKDQTLASVRAGEVHLLSLEISDRKVRFYGRTALVTSKAEVEGKTADGNATGTYRYTRVYARDSRGVWKVVNFEINRVGHSHNQAKSDQQ